MCREVPLWFLQKRLPKRKRCQTAREIYSSSLAYSLDFTTVWLLQTILSAEKIWSTCQFHTPWYPMMPFGVIKHGWLENPRTKNRGFTVVGIRHITYFYGPWLPAMFDWHRRVSHEFLSVLECTPLCLEAPDAATGIFPLFERLLREELEGKEGTQLQAPVDLHWVPLLTLWESNMASWNWWWFNENCDGGFHVDFMWI